jgi:hypothetical protein
MTLDEWNFSDVLNISKAPGAASSTDAYGPCTASVDNANLVEVCNGLYGENGWLGIALYAEEAGHITAGFVKLNDFYLNNVNGGIYDTPDWRQSVLCQELGHIWGLGHNDENFKRPPRGTCMDYATIAQTSPNEHDYDMLLEIYNHDGTSSGGGGETKPCNPRKPSCTSNAADILAQLKMDGPAQWGRLISKHGPQETYELDFGAGRKVVTFVTWVPEYNHGHHSH